MLDITKYKNSVKHKPALSKEKYLSDLHEIQQLYTNEMTNEHRVVNIGKIYKPLEIKRYDIVTNFICGMVHPCIIYKVDDDSAYAICMSTTDAPHNVHKFEKSRIFNTSYLTNTVIRMSKEEAVGRFVGIFDNKKEADVAFAKVKNLYKDLFKF